MEVNLKDADIGIRTKLDPDPVVVYGDREGIVQSVLELLSNSLDNLPSGGNINIACRREREFTGLASIDVVDDGPGIPKNLRSRIFDLFVTSKADGHGIGLASVRRSVELHGGTVSVIPTDEEGAHIRIQLPVA